jgi:hypothetical protein
MLCTDVANMTNVDSTEEQGQRTHKLETVYIADVLNRH